MSYQDVPALLKHGHLVTRSSEFSQQQMVNTLTWHPTLYIEEKEQTSESQLLWREGNLLRVDESYFNLQIVAVKHQLQIDELEFCAPKVNWEEANLFFFPCQALFSEWEHFSALFFVIIFSASELIFSISHLQALGAMILLYDDLWGWTKNDLFCMACISENSEG